MQWIYPILAIVADYQGNIPFDDVTMMLLPFYNEESEIATELDLAAIREFDRMRDEMTARQLNDLNNTLFDQLGALFIKDYAADNNLDPATVILDDDSVKFKGGLK